MKHFNESFILLILLMSMTSSRTFAQDLVQQLEASQKREKEERAKSVVQNNEYAIKGDETGIFLSDPLMLNGKPLDYAEFNLALTGELTVSKGTAINGQTMKVPFFVYLRRNGNKVFIPGKERPDAKQVKIDMSEILSHAQPGDQLVIEAVRKEDGLVKRILKLPGPGC
jgi:hypothetical protein